MPQRTQGLPTELAGLLRPGAYPHPVSAVRLVETHISWVLLTGEWAYKIPRPVQYAFIDLRDRARRDFLCEEGLRLNLRFAPQLYREVCDIVRREGSAHVGGPGEVLCKALRMRQFPAGDGLDRLLHAGAITPAALSAFGRELADVHAGLPVAPVDDAFADPSRMADALRVNARQTAAVLPALRARLTALAVGLDARLVRLLPAMSVRSAAGRVRECHGDLHAGNVVRIDERLLAFDCLEFEPAFRWIDVADEVAFLHVDLCVRGREAHAHAFLDGYLARSGDYDACRVLDVYRAHRALVRAKVDALSQVAAVRIESWLAAAEDALAPRRPRLLITQGLSGSGKTWFARALAPRLGAVHVRSDVERKRLAGLAETASSRSLAGEGLYAPENSAAVYARLEQSASAVLDAGRTVIVDAAFLKREDRRRFAALAARHGAEATMLAIGAPDSLLRERLAARAADGRDASEADAAVLDWQRGRVEAPAADEGLDLLRIDAAAAWDAAALDALCQRLYKSNRGNHA